MDALVPSPSLKRSFDQLAMDDNHLNSDHLSNDHLNIDHLNSDHSPSAPAPALQPEAGPSHRSDRTKRARNGSVSSQSMMSIPQTHRILQIHNPGNPSSSSLPSSSSTFHRPSAHEPLHSISAVAQARDSRIFPPFPFPPSSAAEQQQQQQQQHQQRQLPQPSLRNPPLSDSSSVLPPVGPESSPLHHDPVFLPTLPPSSSTSHSIHSTSSRCPYHTSRRHYHHHTNSHRQSSSSLSPLRPFYLRDDLLLPPSVPPSRGTTNDPNNWPSSQNASTIPSQSNPTNTPSVHWPSPSQEFARTPEDNAMLNLFARRPVPRPSSTLPPSSHNQSSSASPNHLPRITSYLPESSLAQSWHSPTTELPRLRDMDIINHIPSESVQHEDLQVPDPFSSLFSEDVQMQVDSDSDEQDEEDDRTPTASPAPNIFDQSNALVLRRASTPIATATDTTNSHQNASLAAYNTATEFSTVQDRLNVLYNLSVTSTTNTTFTSTAAAAAAVAATTNTHPHSQHLSAPRHQHILSRDQLEARQLERYVPRPSTAGGETLWPPLRPRPPSQTTQPSTRATHPLHSHTIQSHRPGSTHLTHPPQTSSLSTPARTDDVLMNEIFGSLDEMRSMISMHDRVLRRSELIDDRDVLSIGHPGSTSSLSDLFSYSPSSSNAPVERDRRHAPARRMIEGVPGNIEMGGERRMENVQQDEYSGDEQSMDWERPTQPSASARHSGWNLTENSASSSSGLPGRRLGEPLPAPSTTTIPTMATNAATRPARYADLNLDRYQPGPFRATLARTAEFNRMRADAGQTSASSNHPPSFSSTINGINHNNPSTSSSNNGNTTPHYVPPPFPPRRETVPSSFSSSGNISPPLGSSMSSLRAVLRRGLRTDREFSWSGGTQRQQVEQEMVDRAERDQVEREWINEFQRYETLRDAVQRGIRGQATRDSRPEQANGGRATRERTELHQSMERLQSRMSADGVTSLLRRFEEGGEHSNAVNALVRETANANANARQEGSRSSNPPPPSFGVHGEHREAPSELMRRRLSRFFGVSEMATIPNRSSGSGSGTSRESRGYWGGIDGDDPLGRTRPSETTLIPARPLPEIEGRGRIPRRPTVGVGEFGFGMSARGGEQRAGSFSPVRSQQQQQANAGGGSGLNQTMGATAAGGRRTRFMNVLRRRDPLGGGEMGVFGRRMGDYIRDEDFDSSYESLLYLDSILGEVHPRHTPQNVINGLPSATYGEWAKAGESEERCPICLDDYAQQDPVLKVPECNHWFHKGCLQQWLKTANTCPVCRGRVGQSPRVRSRRRVTIPQAPTHPPPAASPPSPRTTNRPHVHPLSRFYQNQRSEQPPPQTQAEPGSTTWTAGHRRPARMLARFHEDEDDSEEEDEESDSEEEGWAFGFSRRGYPW